MKHKDNGHLEFETTGRSFYANGYVGIMEQGNGDIYIAEGHDGYIAIGGDYDEEMTDEETTELADYMIKLWEKFKS